MKLGRNDDAQAILAEHGRWIARLRDDLKMMDQRLGALERRVSTIEDNLAELTKLYSRLDIAVFRWGSCESGKR